VIIDLGDAHSVRYEARDPITLALTDVTAVITVTDPAGANTTPTVTHTSTGIYDAKFTANAVGTWRWKWAITGAITDVAYGDVQVQDPAPAIYASLTDLKLAAGEITESTRDALLQLALASASRSIDQYCGRRFYPDKVASARQFRTDGATVCGPDGELLFIDDLSTTTGLSVEVGDGTTFTAITNYLTEPANASAKNWPVTGLRRTFGFWTTARVKVTGLWGWPGIPDEVAQATLLQASRLFNRRNSPEGVLGNAEWGLVRVTRVDPDVASLVQPYQIMTVG
jgi:hypothetical protein